jgi:hypothetical protein
MSSPPESEFYLTSVALRSSYLECGDLSPLSIALTCQRRRLVIVPPRFEAAGGDKSAHSKTAALPVPNW